MAYAIFVHDHPENDDYGVGPFEVKAEAEAYAKGVRTAIDDDDTAVFVVELEDPTPWIKLAKDLWDKFH